jgi:hypothetical protein
MFNFKKNLLVVTVLLPVLLAGLKSAYAGPKLEFEATTHDFGVVEQNQIHKYKFLFKNAGDEDLEIIEVKPSCGCTAALLSSKITKSGGTGELEVTFNSGKFKGNVKKSVSVETNEVQIINGKEKPKSVHKLLITATVKYDKKKEEALRRKRELKMKKSKEIKESNTSKKVPLKDKKITAVVESSRDAVVEPSRNNNIDFHPKNIALGKIGLNHDYKRMIKLINLTKDKEYIIEKAEIHIPYIAPMIKKQSILPNNPGEVEIIINVKQPGTLKRGVVSIYTDSSPNPVKVPISWETE